MKLRAPLLALLLAAVTAAVADTQEAELFRPAEQARAQAEDAEAALLAPAGYGAGVAALERARRGYRGGAGIDDVGGLLDRARASFGEAARNAAEARETFTAVLGKRDSARAAEAFRLATGPWAEAEELLQGAARRLEGSDVEGALRRAADAQRLYDTAELQAIKAALLTGARGQVVALGPAGAARFAPKTAARAEGLLQQAEAELDADRSRTEVAERLAAEAEAEAGNALALAGMLRSARESDATPEDLLLEWEASLARGATAAGTAADFSAGPRAAADALAGAVAALRERADQQAGDLRQRDRQIAALEEEIRELDGRLAGASSEARNVTLRLEARERAREQLTRLEQLFAPGEALVLRQGGTIIVRLRGLGFGPGSARLKRAAEPLLSKVGKAAALYPSAPIAVEGHTDSSGDSAANQRLSQARADAVRAYLTQRLQVPAGQLTAIGYGDTRPVASNETEAGRRENRRIDLVITPPAEALP